METIFALASARGKAGVAVIRVSGPAALDVAAEMCGRDLPHRGMTFCQVKNRQGILLDDALVLTFSAPESFTGENTVEFQLHGSISVIDAVLQALEEFGDLRLAEPGEFTRRALENGKLDLAQVEGLSDLIEAETEAQRSQAQEVLSGKLGQLAERWRKDLIRAAALIEATIDFADEDVPVDVSDDVDRLLSAVQADLEREAKGVQIAERIRSGFEIAIVGAPNVGKSTLLNSLAGRPAAITSEYAGTTRDVIEVHMDLSGFPVTILDTAGLRETDNLVEGLGISLARQRAESADIRVFLAEPWEDLDVQQKPDDIRLLPKADLRVGSEGSISGLTGKGIDELVSRISAVLKHRTAARGTATRHRHRQAMTQAIYSLKMVGTLLSAGPDRYDIAAEELRAAIRSLESLVGRVDVENLLDEIFASFCLGK